MKALSACAFIVAVVGLLLAVWVQPPACTGAMAGSMLPDFPAPSSIPAVVI
jgi:hypothetical protein